MKHGTNTLHVAFIFLFTILKEYVSLLLDPYTTMPRQQVVQLRLTGLVVQSAQQGPTVKALLGVGGSSGYHSVGACIERREGEREKVMLL